MIQINFPIKIGVKNDVSHPINGLLVKTFFPFRQPS